MSSSSDITSGELFFEINKIGSGNPALSNFCNFLRRDVDKEFQQSEYSSSRALLRKCRYHMRRSTEAKLKNASELKKLLKTRRDSALNEVSSHEGLIQSNTKLIIDDTDEKLIEIVLLYSSVMTNELLAQAILNKEEAYAIESMKRQTIIAQELKNFSKYLQIETKNLMSLLFLEKENEQYKRCKKAIKDNINAKFLKDGNFQGVRVLNICNLQNNRLAKFLQAAVKEDEGGKVKGLFCAVPRKSIYSLCVRGLHMKKDDSINSYNTSTTISPDHQSNQSTSTSATSAKPGSQGLKGMKRSARVPVNVSNASRKMFEWCWYCYGLSPPHSIAQSVRPPAKGTIKGTKPSYQSDCKHDLSAHIRGVGSAMRIANDSEPLQNDPQRNVRFSRSSTPYDLFAEDGISEEGCFIALCRVLVSKVFKIEDRITASVYLEAARQGYDAIYSEKRDEYVFLKPNHVLPEFLMHVQIVKQSENSLLMSRKSSEKNSSLEKNMIYLPHFESEDQIQRRDVQRREVFNSNNDSNKTNNNYPDTTSSSSHIQSENVRSLNNWIMQVENVLHNPNVVSSLTTVEKSSSSCVSHTLAAETEETILRLKKSTATSEELQKAMQHSMQHKQNLLLGVHKVVDENCLKARSHFINQCSAI